MFRSVFSKKKRELTLVFTYSIFKEQERRSLSYLRLPKSNPHWKPSRFPLRAKDDSSIFRYPVNPESEKFFIFFFWAGPRRA
jgi:hypothetical protein